MNIIYDWLLVFSFWIAANNALLFVISVDKIILPLGVYSLILWLATGGENIFKDRILRKIIKYISYVYIILTFLAVFPNFFTLSPINILNPLLLCFMGYIGIITDAIILYYLYIKIKQFIQF